MPFLLAHTGLSSMSHQFNQPNITQCVGMLNKLIQVSSVLGIIDCMGSIIPFDHVLMLSLGAKDA